MKLSLIVFFLSILTFGQTKITWFNIHYSSFKLFSSTDISIEHPESMFYPINKKDKKQKALAVIKMNLESNRDYKKNVYLSLEDYKEIEDKLLELNSKDIFDSPACLDGYHLILTIGNQNSNTTFDVSCMQREDTNLHKVINFILEKLNIKEKDFYK